MALTYFTSGYTANSVTQTITHGLGRTAASLRAYITPKNAAAAADVPFVGSITSQIITIVGATDASLCDITVLEFHSIQGNG